MRVFLAGLFALCAFGLLACTGGSGVAPAQSPGEVGLPADPAGDSAAQTALTATPTDEPPAAASDTPGPAATSTDAPPATAQPADPDPETEPTGADQPVATATPPPPQPTATPTAVAVAREQTKVYYIHTDW